MESLKKAPSFARIISAVSADDTLNLVVVGLTEPEFRVLRDLAGECCWKVCRVPTCREAMARLCLERTPVILCNSQLPDGTWEDVLSGTADRNNPPRIIVTATHADERLWLDVLGMGGFDVLPAPLSGLEVRRSVEAAWRNWRDEVGQENWRRPKQAAAGLA